MQLRHWRRPVLLSLCLSRLLGHMTSRCTVMSGGHGKWVSWDRTSSLVLCEGEDPCLGLFVCSALSPTAGHPRPAGAACTSLSPDGSSCSRCDRCLLSPACQTRARASYSSFGPGLTSDPLSTPPPPADGEALWCRAPATTADLRGRGCPRLKVSSVTEGAGGKKKRNLRSLCLREAKQ